MPYSSLVLHLNESTKTQIDTLLSQAEQAIPKLVSLTSKEKRKGFSFGKKADSAFSKTKALIESNPHLLPAWFQSNDFYVKVDDRQRLNEIHSRLQKLTTAVGDTVKALEQESTAMLLSFYQQAQSASDQNVPGAKAVCSEMANMVNRRKKRGSKA